LVHLLEVESEIESTAYQRVLEFVAPDIEGERLHHTEIANRKLFKNDALFPHGGKVISGRPALGAVLGAPVDLIGLEGFERDSGVAEVVETNVIEIVGADVHIDSVAPVILHALVDERAAGHEFLEPVRAGAKRRLERRLRDLALLAGLVGAFPPVFRQHRKLADDVRKFAVAGAVEGERDVALAGLFRFDHVSVIGGELRTVLLEYLE